MYPVSRSPRPQLKKTTRRGKFGLNQLSKHGVLTEVSTSASSHDGKAGRTIWFNKLTRNQGKPWEVKNHLSYEHGLGFQLIQFVNKVSVLIGSLMNQLHLVIRTEGKPNQSRLNWPTTWINIKSQSYRVLSSFNFLISSSSVSTTYETQSREEHWLWCFCL